jgi:hypothetical protein
MTVDERSAKSGFSDVAMLQAIRAAPRVTINNEQRPSPLPLGGFYSGDGVSAIRDSS